MPMKMGVSKERRQTICYIFYRQTGLQAIGGKNLVTNVSMHVKKGEIYGFLGPNGAGKTTVMKLSLIHI